MLQLQINSSPYFTQGSLCAQTGTVNKHYWKLVQLNQKENFSILFLLATLFLLPHTLAPWCLHLLLSSWGSHQSPHNWTHVNRWHWLHLNHSMPKSCIIWTGTCSLDFSKIQQISARHKPQQTLTVDDGDLLSLRSYTSFTAKIPTEVWKDYWILRKNAFFNFPDLVNSEAFNR